MGVFSCFKGDPEDQPEVKIAKPCKLKRMWRGVKARFSKKTRREKKLLKALVDEAEKAEKRKFLGEQREIEKEEAQAFEMVRILWGLDEVQFTLRKWCTFQEIWLVCFSVFALFKFIFHILFF